MSEATLSPSTNRSVRTKLQTNWQVVLLATGCVIGLILRFHVALATHGITWPDELIKSWEQAHHLVFGYGYKPWEYRKGTVNWTFAGSIAGFLKLGTIFGFNSPRTYLGFVRFILVALNTLTAVAIYRIVVNKTTNKSAALVGSLIFLGNAIVIYFSYRALPEVYSAPFVLFGFLFALQAKPSNRRLVLGASLLGYATLVRLQNIIFCAVTLGYFLCRRDWKQAKISGITFAVWAFIYGLMDQLTWHSWFHSPIAYLRFNLNDANTEIWGHQSTLYFFHFFYHAMPILIVVLGILTLFAIRRTPELVIAIVLYFVAHSLVGHKEPRFIYVIIPLLCVTAAIGLNEVRRYSKAFYATVAISLVCLTVFSSVRYQSVTWGQLADTSKGSANQNAYYWYNDVNMLLLTAHNQKDLCGIKVESAILTETGIYTYLHKDVPFYDRNSTTIAGQYNYVISRNKGDGQVIAKNGRLYLIRTGNHCVAKSSKK